MKKKIYVTIDDFSKWLDQKTFLKQASIKKYSSALNLIASSKEVIQLGDLFSTFNVEVLKSFEESYFSNSENKRKNTDGKNMYSCAIHHYQRFISYLIDDSQEPSTEILNSKINYIVNNKSYDESTKAYYLHVKKERKPQLIRNAKKNFKKQNGHLYCQKCNFNKKNEIKYGSDIIEGHHIIPVESLTDKNIKSNTINNILLLCPNCHKKIHTHMRIEKTKLDTKTKILDLRL